MLGVRPDEDEGPMSLGDYLTLLEWGAYAAFAAAVLSLACVALLVCVLVKIASRRQG